jgi:CRP-like cAMP-binding protein
MAHIDELKKISIFAEFSPSELSRLSSLFTERRFRAGEVMIPEQAENREVMILVEGQVAVEVATRLGQNAEKLVLTMELTPGRIIEWSSAIDTVKSGGTASARAVKDTAVLVADGTTVYKACQDDPKMGMKFIHQILLVIASRLRDTRQQLVSMAAQCGS